MARYRRRSRATVQRSPLGPQTVSVRVSVPERLRLPSVLRLVPPRQLQRRSRAVRVELKKPVGRFVRKRVRLILPRRPPRVRESYSIIYADRISNQSYKKVRKVMPYEYNKKRYVERKSNRHRVAGQISSVSKDPRGIVAYAARHARDPRQIEYAAAVSRALERVR